VPAAEAERQSPQERQIATLAAEGRTNREIGAPLFLSPRTVETHLGRVFAPDLPPVGPADALESMLQGLADFEADDVPAAVVSLRRTLYLDSRLGLAAFQLGRAHEALGDRGAARRAYQQALRTFEGDDAPDLDDAVLGQVDLDDIIVAVRMRLDALATATY